MSPTVSAADLSLEDRARLLTGADFWTTAQAPGVASIVMSDGPHGGRRQTGGSDHLGLNAAAPATCFPPAVGLAQTWDPALAERVGAPVWASPFSSRLSFPEDHPLFAGFLAAAPQAVSDALAARLGEGADLAALTREAAIEPGDLAADLGDATVLMADTCLDEFTDHGHCGVLADDGTVDGDGAADVVSGSSPCSPGGSALPATQVAHGTDQSPFCHCSNAGPPVLRTSTTSPGCDSPKNHCAFAGLRLRQPCDSLRTPCAPMLSRACR